MYRSATFIVTILLLREVLSCTGPIDPVVYVKNAQGSIRYSCRTFDRNCLTLMLRLNLTQPLFVLNSFNYSGSFDSDQVQPTDVSIFINCIAISMFQAFASGINGSDFTPIPGTDQTVPINYLLEVISFSKVISNRYNSSGMIVTDLCDISTTPHVTTGLTPVVSTVPSDNMVEFASFDWMLIIVFVTISTIRSIW